MRAPADAHEQALRGGPRGLDALVATVLAHLGVDPFGGAAKRELAQGDEVPLAEERVGGAHGLGAEVDLALLEPLPQLVRGQIHEADLVGQLEHRVGHRLPYDHAGDLGHHVVEALDVLHVQGGVDMDPCRQQLLDVLPALLVAGALGVRVGQLVDQDELGLARERAVQIELLEGDPPIGDRPPWEQLEALQELRGLAAAVGLDDSDHRVRGPRPPPRGPPPAWRRSCPPRGRPRRRW